MQAIIEATDECTVNVDLQGPLLAGQSNATMGVESNCTNVNTIPALTSQNTAVLAQMPEEAHVTINKDVAVPKSLDSNAPKVCNRIPPSHRPLQNNDEELVTLASELRIKELITNLQGNAGCGGGHVVFFKGPWHRECQLLVDDIFQNFMAPNLKLKSNALHFLMTSVWVGMDVPLRSQYFLRPSNSSKFLHMRAD